MASERVKAGLLEGPRQVLTFSLGSEIYGVDILRVREIRGWSSVTRIPRVPPHVLGVLNLRGSIVPILDMRVRFGLPQPEFTPLTAVIVLSVGSPSDARHREFGLVVDAVADVIDIVAEQLKEAPKLGPAAEFIDGLAVAGERMLILLKVEELIQRDTEPRWFGEPPSVA